MRASWFHFASLWAAMLMLAVGGCGVPDSKPGGSGGKPGEPVFEDLPEQPASSDAEPPQMSARILRRAWLMLTRQLPPRGLANRLIKENAEIGAAARGLIGSYGYSRALASELVSQWRLGERHLFGLRDGNSRLIDGFTPEMQRHIAAELREVVAFNLQQGLRYPAWIGQSLSVMRRELSERAAFAPEVALFPGSAYDLGSYADGRNALGMLSTNALRAASDKPHLFANAAVAAKVMRSFYCSAGDDAQAHALHGLDPETMAHGAAALSQGLGSCAGCHRDMGVMARAMPRAGSDWDADAWFSVAAPGALAPGLIFGKAFQDVDGLRSTLAGEARLKSCLVRNLVGIYLRKGLEEADPGTVSAAFAAYDEDQKVDSVLAVIVNDKAFRAGADTEDAQSGTLVPRVMSLEMFHGVLSNLVPAFGSVQAPMVRAEMVAGADLRSRGEFDFESMEAFRYLAERFAAMAVDADLKDGTASENRLLLTEVPAGQALGATRSEIHSQVEALFERLTAVDIERSGNTFKGLKRLWDRQSRKNAVNIAGGWRDILVAILLSPDFLTY